MVSGIKASVVRKLNILLSHADPINEIELARLDPDRLVNLVRQALFVQLELGHKPLHQVEELFVISRHEFVVLSSYRHVARFATLMGELNET